jgi:hypothetical protein
LVHLILTTLTQLPFLFPPQFSEGKIEVWNEGLSPALMDITAPSGCYEPAVLSPAQLPILSTSPTPPSTQMLKIPRGAERSLNLPMCFDPMTLKNYFYSFGGFILLFANSQCLAT